MSTSNRLTALGILTLTFCLAVPAGAALVYNFDVAADDGATTQGWIHTRGGPSVPVDGGRGASVGGGGAAGQEDGVHPNLVFSSPAFFLDGSGPLTFQLHGGTGVGDAQAATFYSSLSNIPVGDSTADANGRQYVALRRVSDGAYLLNGQRPAQNNDWVTVSFSQAQLAPFVLAGVSYQLDLIETRHGGWGHTEIDDVSIPGVLVPEPAAMGLLGLAGMVVLRRKR